MTRLGLVPFLVLTLCTTVLAGELKVGDSLPALTLKDQNGEAHAIGNSLRYLVFAPDRSSSQIVAQSFKSQTAASLQSHGVVYVADIKGMPSVVASWFALPKMRQQPYPILLGRETADTAMLPRQVNCVTVISGDNGHVTVITFLHNPTELCKVLGLD
jgi:hypothetical protein